MDTLVDFIPLFQGYAETPAVIHRTGIRRFVYSYGDIHTLILRMNRLLADAGVGKGDRVVLWAPNSPWWLVTFWGVMARGAVLVPVDFMSRRERAETIAALTEPRLVIQSSAKADQVTGYPTLLIEELEFRLTECEPLEELATSVPDDCAEIVYTSGTTGNPKGVVLCHRNLVANLQQINSHLPIVTSDFTFLSLLPLSHMFEQMGGFLTPLCHGATIVYIRTLKPSAIMEALSEEDIYAVVAVPRLLGLLKGAIEERFRRIGLLPQFNAVLQGAGGLPKGVRHLLFAPIRRKFGRNFTLFVSGGAALAVDVFTFWSALGFTVIEGYGLTECSPVLTANSMTRQIAGAVGEALPGVELRLADGEVQAHGTNVFSGYYRNPDATADAFTSDGWYRTGDLGELDADGILRLKGRAKDLIVTGAGINVYPDEIEELLNRQPGVKDSCVIGLDRGAGDEVHAVLLLMPGGSAEQAVAAANVRLDDLHRITGYTVWSDDDFPRTTTMKIRKFLVREQLRSRDTSAGPSSAGDRLTGLIARITGTPAVEVGEDSLLVNDLGLTSIGRLELVNAIEGEFRLDLDESVITPGTRVRDLRALVEKRTGKGRELSYRRWTATWLFDQLRTVADMLLHRPLIAPFVKLRIEGVENLNGVEQPVIFIANHVSYLDQPAVAQALPCGWRRRTATAAWAEFFFSEFRTMVGRIWKRLTYEYGSVFLHLFPLPQSAGFRGALRHMGYLVDHGYNILVFPEGARSADGRLLPFQKGLGIMVAELGLPVVPVAIIGMEHVLPRGAGFPRRGEVTVRFGAPLWFAGAERDEIVTRARQAVDELMQG